jgi:cytochrome c553
MPKHIKRLIILMIGFGVLGYAAKQLFTANTFYQFGHYRAASVPEIAAQQPAYQTPAYCKSCHEERYAQWSAANHKTVICEVCHGAAKGHPENGKLPIPGDTRKLCTLCHEAMPGRPQAQPQVDLGKHSGGQQCIVCHNPHAPKIGGVAVAVKGNAAAGAKKHDVCAGCHGSKGLSENDTWPNLAGQNAAYLARILAAYKSGDQQDVAMTPIAQDLGDADIQDLAAYYASLSCKAAKGGRGPGNAAAGKELAAKNCVACHGETGIGSNPAWPKIAGQKSGYLINVLKAFRAGLRKDPSMGGITRGLSDADIADVATYFAQQTCR